MPQVEFLYRGIVKLKSNTLHWDNDQNSISSKRTPNTIPVRVMLEHPPNYVSVTRLGRDCVGIQISDGMRTVITFIKEGVKTRCTINRGIRDPLEGWREFQVVLLSEHCKALNKLYKPMSGFLSLLMSQSPELRKPFRSWFKSGNEVFIFDCVFTTHRDKVYHFHVLIENERHPAIIGLPLRRLFKKIKSIKDKGLTHEPLHS